MKLRRHVARSRPAGLSFADQALISGATFIGGILFARVLGLGEFGRFTLAWMVVEFVAALQYAAVLQPMLNIGPKRSPGDAAPYYGATLILQVACSIVSAISVLVVAIVVAPFWTSADISGVAAPLSVTILATQAHNYLRRYLYARERRSVVIVVDGLRYGLQIGLTLLIAQTAWFTVNAGASLWIVAGTAGASAVPAIWLLRPISFDRMALRHATRRHWHFSKWLVPSTVLRSLSGQIVMMIAGLVLGVAAVGAVSAVKTLLGAVNVLLMGIENFAPVQSVRALHLLGVNAFHRYVRSLAIVTTGGALTVVLCISVDPDRIIHLVYGTRFSQIGYLLPWLAVPYVLFALSTVLAIWAAAIESTKIIFQSSFVSTLAAAIVAYPFVRYFGVVGVPASFVIVEVVRVLVLFWGLRGTRGIAREIGEAAGRRQADHVPKMGIRTDVNVTVGGGS